MARSQLQSAVVQTTLFIALNYIVTHEIDRNAYNSVWDDEVFSNYTNVLFNRTQVAMGNATASSAYNGTDTNNLNSTWLNATSPAATSPEESSFYFKTLPRNLLVYALLVPLSYYWHIFLERFFPARPRGVEVHHDKQEKVVDVHEDHEEEVVKRWIAQGKVRRSSLSWWNTFVKWVLHLTVGKLVYEVVFHLVEGCVKLQPLTTTFEQLRRHVIVCTVRSFLSIGPLASLVGFVVIPASKRVVFRAGVDFLESVFISAFLRLTVPWAVRTQLVQSILLNATSTMNNLQALRGAPFNMEGRLIDEL
ncbi:hypothetical protein BJ170DRAFT_681430 [Xylariales sp. AK1849]|nr:hypothetical protein BJ170DRAFT_681430 [Xylariales sp. AK1849]